MQRPVSDRRLGIILGSLLLTAALGCATVERKGVNLATPILQDAVDNLLTYQSVNVAEEGLPGNVLLISALCEFSPNNHKLLALASMAYGAYGLLIEEENPEYATEIYTIGADYGLRSIKSSNKKVKTALEKGGFVFDQAASLKKKDVPGAFWFAMDLGLKIMLNMSDPVALTKLSDVNTVMEKIYELDDSYFFYAPHLYKGAYNALAGPMLSGGLPVAKKEFDIIFEKTDNKFLLAHAFFARFYATAAMDEALFDKTVDYILKTPDDAMHEARLANGIAKKKARWYKAHREDFF